MKWVPLTDITLQLLRSNGYTHFVIKNVTGETIAEIERECVTLEAVKGRMQFTGSEMIAISSDLTEAFLHSDSVDYYVFYK